MLHIVHIEERFHPDYGYQVQESCRLHSPSFKITVLTSESLGSLSKSITGLELAEKDKRFLDRTGATIVRLPVRFELREKIWIKGLGKALAELKPDLVYSHGVEYLSFARILLGNSRPPFALITDSHDLPASSTIGMLRYLYRKGIRLFLANRINKRRIPVLYTGLETKQLLAEYGIDEALQISCQIGTDPEKYRFCTQARHEFRTKHALGDRLVLAYVGKLDSLKQPHQLLRALLDLSTPRLQEIAIVIVGQATEPYHESVLRPILAECESKKVKVLVLPAMKSEDLYKVYSAIDLCVFPRECTLSSLDALSCGVPLVMADNPTNRDRLASAGRLFKQDDIGDLKNVLEELLSIPTQWKAMGAAGKEHVQRCFNYKSIVQGLESLMQSECLRAK